MRTKLLAAIILSLCCLMFTVACNPTDTTEGSGSTETNYPQAPTTPSDDTPIPEDEYQRIYYHQYLSAWGLYNPFRRDFTEATFYEAYSPYFLFYSALGQEERCVGYATEHGWGVDIPANEVEAIVLRHFPLTAEQYRETLPYSADAYEYYDPTRSIYHFPGGYGGAEMNGIVSNVVKEGNILTIDCDWYDDANNSVFSHSVKILLGDDPIDFRYIGNTVTGWAPEVDSLSAIAGLAAAQGCWKSDSANSFVTFIPLGNGMYSYDYGIMNSGFGRSGIIGAGELISENVYRLSVHFEAIPPNMMNDGSPEQTVDIQVDLSELRTQGTIRVLIPNFANDDYHTYTYLAATTEEGLSSL